MSEFFVPHEDAPVPEARRPEGNELNRLAIPLPPGAAEGLREFARNRGSRRGLRSIAARKEPWTVVLAPSKEIRKALKANEVVLTKTKKGGQLLPQARNVKTGQVAENIPLKGAGPASKGAQGAKAVTAGVAVAWQAMAIATQQHYLVEITSRLSNIERGIAEVVRGYVADKASRLNSTERELSRIEGHIASGLPLADDDRQDVRAWHKEAHTTCDAQVRLAGDIISDSERDSADAVPHLLVADRAAQVAARCVAALLRLPPETPEKHLAEFWHYSDLSQELLDDVNELFSRLATELSSCLTAWRQYVFSNPDRKAKKAWNAGPGRAKRLRWGLRRPRFNGLAELDAGEMNFLLWRAKVSKERGLEAVPATVILDGKGARVLVGAEEEAPGVA